MSLNNITLSTLLLTDLYPDVLIESYATHVPEKPAPDYTWKSKKRILIIVSKGNTNIISEFELNFLNNILLACKLSLAKVAIINWPIAETSYAKFLETLESEIILLLNIDPISFGLPINFPQFQIQAHNKRIYLHAPSLLEIENNIDLKKQLWASLKLLFSV